MYRRANVDTTYFPNQTRVGHPYSALDDGAVRNSSQFVRDHIHTPSELLGVTLKSVGRASHLVVWNIFQGRPLVTAED